MTTTSETTLIMPATAKHWLSNNLYERQRPRSELQVKRLVREMELERFMEGTPIHFAICNGQENLINGQHTLAAISASGMSQTLTVMRSVVRDEQEMAALYSRHDRHKGRTPHDGFLAMGVADQFQLLPSEVNSFAPGLKLLLNGFRKVTKDDDPELHGSIESMAGHMQQWQDVARVYFEGIRDAATGLKGPYKRAAVVAVALATLRGDKADLAAEFWRSAAMNEGLTRNDPRLVLNTYLLTNTTVGRNPVVYMRHVARCWNAFHDNGEIKVLRAADQGKIGVTIKGTKYRAQWPDGRSDESVPVAKQMVLKKLAGSEARA